MYMKKIPCWERSSKILILNLSYNEDGIDKLLEVFMCANLLCLMTGILENVPAPFQSIPTIFRRLTAMSLKMMEDFQMNF